MPELSPECAAYYMTTGTCFSPVLIDVKGDGFSLTDRVKEKLSWTAAGSDDA